MRPFPLQQLERHLSEKHLLQGESLLSGQQVKDLREIERHLWEASVDGQEVEIQISPQSVKAATCDCRDFAEEQMCGHLAATLLAIRRVKTKPPAKPTVLPTQKLTVGGILDQVNASELQDFVREYARSNRNFSIALKTRFAGQVPMANQRSKYDQLFNAALKAARNKNNHFSFRGVQKILHISEELLRQAVAAAASSHFHETFALVSTLIEKLVPIQYKTEYLQTEIKTHIDRAVQILQQMVNAYPPPDLKEAIWEYATQLCQQSRFQKDEVLFDFFKILLDLVDDKQKGNTLMQFLQEQAAGHAIGSRYRSRVMVFLLQLLEKQKEGKRIAQLVPDYLEDPDFLFYAAGQAMDKKEWERAARLLEMETVLALFPAKREQWEALQLELALATKQSDAVVHFGGRRFLTTHDPDLLPLLQLHAGADWQQTGTLWIQALLEQPYTLAVRDAVAALYVQLKQWSELAHYIRSIQSLDLLTRFDPYLSNVPDIDLYELYESLLINYLRHHLGRKPSQKIRTILAHLHQSNLGKLADKLLIRFREEFGERNSLMEELAVF